MFALTGDRNQCTDQNWLTTFCYLWSVCWGKIYLTQQQPDAVWYVSMGLNFTQCPNWILIEIGWNRCISTYQTLHKKVRCAPTVAAVGPTLAQDSSTCSEEQRRRLAGPWKRNHFLLVLLLFTYFYWLCHVWVMLLMFWAADFQHRCTKLSWSFYDGVVIWDMQFLYAKYNPFAPLPFPDTPTGPPRRCAGVCSLVANHIGSIRRDQGKGQRTGMSFQ